LHDRENFLLKTRFPIALKDEFSYYSSIAAPNPPEPVMSQTASDFLDLRAMNRDAVLERFLRELATRLISAGVRDERVGC
jgi:hypothetical protein